MRKTASLGAVAALALPVAALAADGISHTFVEAGYVRSEIKSYSSFDSNGFRLAGSYELPANVVIDAAFEQVRYGDLEKWKEYEAGLKYKVPLAGNADLLAGASWQGLDADGTNLNGFGLGVGARALLTDKLLVSAQLEYIDYDKGYPSTFVASVGGRWYFTPAFSAGIDVRKTDKLIEASETRLGALFRYDFGSGR
ncbi:MAG: hypothetical protein DIU62_001455 [Pseudomonadota bacterium]|jgi:hypothetical protein|nr:MAG: hypothetical protein DIU62_00400 [Pseudomonadota bacterium]